MTHDPPATFRALVFAMRCAQKAEQRVMSRTNRREAKRFEDKVDAWLVKHMDETGDQLEWEEARHDDDA